MSKLFTFVSYNIRHQVNLYMDMVNFVQNNPYTIAAIQERPNIEEMERISLNMPSNVKHLYKKTENYLAIIYSKNLVLNEICLDNSIFDMKILEDRTLNVQIDFPQESVYFINVHGYSKIHNDYEDLNEKMFKFLNCLKKPPKHIVMGDFNMNPFEANLFDEATFMSFREKEFVETTQTEKPVYYNPCWKYLCEREHPKGTLFYEGSMLGWDMFDQVLISKDLVSSYKSFEIPKTLGKKEISPLNCKKEKTFTDHMPIKLTLEM